MGAGRVSGLEQERGRGRAQDRDPFFYPNRWLSAQPPAKFFGRARRINAGAQSTNVTVPETPRTILDEIPDYSIWTRGEAEAPKTGEARSNGQLVELRREWWMALDDREGGLGQLTS